MKVALVHNHSLTYMGGGETFILRLAKALSGQGLNVSIYSLPIGRRGGVDVKGLLGPVDYREATATPTSPLSGSAATMEKVKLRPLDGSAGGAISVRSKASSARPAFPCEAATRPERYLS